MLLLVFVHPRTFNSPRGSPAKTTHHRDKVVQEGLDLCQPPRNRRVKRAAALVAVLDPIFPAAAAAAIVVPCRSPHRRRSFKRHRAVASASCTTTTTTTSTSTTSTSTTRLLLSLEVVGPVERLGLGDQGRPQIAVLHCHRSAAAAAAAATNTTAASGLGANLERPSRLLARCGLLGGEAVHALLDPGVAVHEPPCKRRQAQLFRAQPQHLPALHYLLHLGARVARSDSRSFWGG